MAPTSVGAALLLALASEPTAAGAPDPVPAASTPEGVDGDRAKPILLVQTDLLPAVGADASAARGDAATDRGFRLRRARAGVDAAQGGWRARAVLELHAEGDAGLAVSRADGSLPHVTEAYVGWRASAAFHAEAGSLRVPFSLSRQIDEADLRLAERPLSVQAVAPEFRVGASAAGDLGLFQYAAGVFDSDERGLDGSLAARGTLVVARLSAEPIGPVGVASWLRRSSDPWWPWWRWSIGGSGFYDARSGPDNYGAEGDAQIQWRRFTATGEFLWARRQPQRLGAVVEPGLFVWRDRLEIVARAEWFDAAYGLPDASSGWVVAAGATYYAAFSHARISAMFHHRQERDVALANDWALLRLSLAL